MHFTEGVAQGLVQVQLQQRVAPQHFAGGAHA